MCCPAIRSSLRRPVLPTSISRLPPPNRTLFTSARKRSSFKTTALRWCAAGGLVYYYTTSSVFADEPRLLPHQPTPIPPEEDERPPSLLDEVSRAKKAAAEEKGAVNDARVGSASPEELEEEAGQEGAFNPDTGEINWDCPCLGGMAHGPCGEEFKAAFSCFVYSTADPKGVDCIDKFRGMQTCFQKYPEIYGAELDDEDEEEVDAKLEARREASNPEKTTQEAPAKTPEEAQAKKSEKAPEVLGST